MTEEDIDKQSEDAYMDEVYSDGRLDSGIDKSAVNDDLGFINMSGLTAPSPSQPVASPPEYGDDDLDPEAPVSFYEEGVDDVDSGMDPGNVSILDDEVLGREPNAEATAPRPGSSLEGLQAIISELSKSDEAPASAAPSESSPAQPGAKNDNEDVASILESVDASVFDEIEIPAETVPEESGIDVDIEDIVAHVDTSDLIEEVETIPADVDDMDVSDLISSINFEEAESLIEELESQPKDAPLPEIQAQPEPTPDPEPELHVDLDSLSTTPPPVYIEPKSEHLKSEAAAIPTIDLSHLAGRNEDGEQDASIYSKPQLPASPLRNRRHRNSSSVLGRLTILLVLLVALGLAGIYGFEQLRTQSMTPGEAYSEGMTLLDEGRLEEASNHFQYVARAYAHDPVGPDAEFMAGYSLFVFPESEGSVARNAYTQSRLLLQSFLDKYPEHEKATRAETMTAMLLYKTGEYASAIEILDDPDRRLRDPDGYLPAMRTLGRAYARQMDYAKAEIALMRAASLDENLAPDQDYLEIAAMFNDLGTRESSDALAAQYLEKAVEHWDRAAKSPGTISSKRRELSVLIEYTEGRIAELRGSSASAPSAIPDEASKPLTDEIEVPEEPPTEIDFDSLRLPDDAP